jgi:hypothetical protein
MLSWFSCVTARIDDETFYASTITNHLLSPQTTASDNAALPVGAIVGIAVGGAVFLITFVALVVYFCFRRKNRRAQEQRDFERWRQHQEQQGFHEMPTHMDPTELDSYSAAVEGDNQTYYQYGAWKPAAPVAELPGVSAVSPPKNFSRI